MISRAIATGIWVLAMGVGAAATAGAATESNSVVPGGPDLPLSHGRVSVPRDASRRTRTQEAAFQRELTRMVTEGASWSTIEKALDLRMQGTPTQSDVPEVAGVEAPAAPSPMSPVEPVAPAAASSCPAPTGGTAPSAMTVYTPVMLATVNGSTRWYVTARWAWKNGQAPHEPGFSCTVNVGGRDGFGVTFSRSVVNYGETLYTCNEANSCTYGLGSLSDNSAYGAAFTFQDTASTMFHNNHHGTLTFSYKNPGGCLQVASKYAHTWSTTSVNGFGIGPWSISAQWTVNAHNWALASPAGRSGC